MKFHSGSKGRVPKEFSIIPRSEEELQDNLKVVLAESKEDQRCSK